MMRRQATLLAAAVVGALAAFCLGGPARAFAEAAGGAGVPQKPPIPLLKPTPLPNVIKTTVWAGPYGSYVNGPFARVTLCVPATGSCETIGGLLVDTGSSGLRIFAEANHLKLPTETTAAGAPVAECMPFGTIATWGKVAYADVRMGNEPAIASVPIQIINAGYASMPPICRSGPPVAQSAALTGFNGILGVGLFTADCGDVCATLGAQNPSMYFACPGGTCGVTAVADAAQVQNPVALLPEDNNGVVLKMPSVPFLGAPTASGNLVLGINTRRNNKLGGAFVYRTDGAGNIATTYDSVTMDGFIDSGSNALFFDNRGLTQCDPSLAPGFYCPPTLLVMGAVNTGRAGSASGMVYFSVANALGLANTGNRAFYDVAGTFGGPFFDFGLPFFFGRNVYIGIDGQTVRSAGAGPFFAY